MVAVYPIRSGARIPKMTGVLHRVGAVVLIEDGVQVGQHGGGGRVVDGCRAQGVAGLRGDGGGVDALAADVAEEEPPPAVGEWEQVVEVAADLIRGGHVVVGGGLHSGWPR
jgi:hypothetical protein